MLKWNKNCAKLTCSVTCSKISRDRRSEPSRWIWMLHEKWPLPKHTHKSTNKQILPGSNIPPLYKSSCYGKTDWLASRQFPDPQLTKSFVWMLHPRFVPGGCICLCVHICVSLVVCVLCVRARVRVFFFSLFFFLCWCYSSCMCSHACDCTSVLSCLPEYIFIWAFVFAGKCLRTATASHDFWFKGVICTLLNLLWRQ